VSVDHSDALFGGRFSYSRSDKAFLAVSGVEDRLRKATEIFNKQSDILEVPSKISRDVGESYYNQQKEFFLLV
jgi:ATP-dependent Lon protease